MKNIKWLVAFWDVVLILGLIGCSQPVESHQHTFAEKWSKDTTHHWKVATCEHTEEVSEKTAHSFGEWITTKQPTELTTGSKARSCIVCTYTETEVIPKLSNENVEIQNTTYTVTFNATGGIFPDNTAQTVKHGEKITEPSIPTKDGFIFDGWYTSDYGGLILSETAYDFSVPVTSNVYLYAKWEKGFLCTADNVAEIISGLVASETPYRIDVVGEISNDTVFAISSALKENTSVKVNLDLENTTGLTEIGEKAFQDCSSLTSIVIPEGVTSIENYAFSDCSNLASVEIPASVTNISGYSGLAFEGCRNLKNFSVDKNNLRYSSSVDGAILFNRNKSYLIAFPSASGEVVIPDGVTEIMLSAFQYCSNLTSVVIPEGVTFIGCSAFAFCYNLTSIVIPASVERIMCHAFMDCRRAEVTFMDPTTWYYTSDFYDFENGTQIDVTVPSDNATYLSRTYYDEFWYKK
ncbi:MAG: leucine-rich repeat protein [Treponema sp.]|nr:leucine-rich repeat protein [Treponema sp.]